MSLSLALPLPITHMRTKYELTRERISFTHGRRDMLLSLHFVVSFYRAVVACAILKRTSGHTFCRFFSRLSRRLLVPAPLQQEHQCHRHSRLVIVLVPLLTLVWCSSRASDLIVLNHFPVMSCMYASLTALRYFKYC